MKNKVWVVIQKLNEQFTKDRDYLCESYRKNLTIIYEDFWLKELILSQHWYSYVESLLEWSSWEASEIECKDEVINTFESYLDDENKEIFSECILYNMARETIREYLIN